MNRLNYESAGVTPITFRFLNLSCLFCISALALPAAALLPVPSFAASDNHTERAPIVTPLDKEQDLQNKIRLQEKITRELEENRRRVREQSQKDPKEVLSPESSSRQVIDGVSQ